MSYSRPLSKLSAYYKRTAKLEEYKNDGLPEAVASIGNTLDYIIASLFPNAKEAVDTEADLPTTGNEVNDYRIVRDYNSTGQAAGYRYFQKEGQATPQWNLVQLFDSQDSVLQQWEQNASGLYVNQNGQPGGQTIHGSTDADENLTLSPNAGDGSNDPANQTGYVQLFGDTRPTHNNVFDLGTAAEQFASLYLAGMISDGVDSVTVAQMASAFLHSQIVSENPHNVDYEELVGRLGNLTINGDVSETILDMSTNGDKTLTLSITDDSHNHTVSTITDFTDETWALLKARLVNSDDITYAFNDTTKEVTATVTVSTANISDIASPSVNKVLTSTSDGAGWEATDGTVELTGDISGTANYDSTSKKTSVAATVENVAIENIDRIDVSNLAVSVSAANPAIVSLADHGMVTGRTVRLIGTDSLDGTYTITKVNDSTFSIPVDNGAGVVESGHVIPNGSQFLYDAATDTWKVQLEFKEISHHEISNLNGDDHAQYLNINGRGDGSANIVTGGELAGSNLVLRSNSSGTAGVIYVRDSVLPETGASYSGGSWNGTDLGSSSRPFRDIHVRGEVKGFRPEEVSSLPIPTAQDTGRIVKLSTDNKLYYNVDGTVYEAIGTGAEGASEPQVNTVNFGDPTVDGSWRLTTSGSSLVIQVRTGGAWITKDELQP